MVPFKMLTVIFCIIPSEVQAYNFQSSRVFHFLLWQPSQPGRKGHIASFFHLVKEEIAQSPQEVSVCSLDGISSPTPLP